MANQLKIKRYGWRPDKPDHRDVWYHGPRLATTAPPKFDQRSRWPDPYDQLQLGSCTANVIAGLVQKRLIDTGKIALANANQPQFTPSRLFIYWNERYTENSVGTDSGAEIRDGIKSLVDKGVCFEDVLPYSDDTDTSNGKIPPFVRTPSHQAFKIGAQHRIKRYARVDNTNVTALKLAISAEDPVSIGFTVYDSFESDQTAKDGFVLMPKNTESIIGGHAVAIVGYDDTLSRYGYTGFFTVRNSLGKDWGDGGYCYFPYAYLTNPNLASDSWIITAMAA